MTKKIQAGLWSCLQPPLQRRTRLPVEGAASSENYPDIEKIRSCHVKESMISVPVRFVLGFSQIPLLAFAFCYSKFHLICDRKVQPEIRGEGREEVLFEIRCGGRS
jgi:hypothetical protein